MKRAIKSRRRRGRKHEPAGIKVDFLIPRLQDDTKRPHPHTAYEEWDTLLMEHGIHPPTLAQPERGREGWAEEFEDSLHWWTGVREEQVPVLLELLERGARRIFHQRWMIAWIGERFFQLPSSKKG